MSDYTYWSLPARGAWIEMFLAWIGSRVIMSLPARGAWIEIDWQIMSDYTYWVAPRKGSVD